VPAREEEDAVLILGLTPIVVEVVNDRRRAPLSGEFTLARQAETVSARDLERDFCNRLARKGSAPESVPEGWKSGSPQALPTSTGWLADRPYPRTWPPRPTSNARTAASQASLERL